MTRVAIVDGIRTPFVKAGDRLSRMGAQELGRIAVRELLEKTDIDPATVDEVIIGNVAQPMEATNISRVIELNSGMPLSMSAHTVSRNCASGLQSIAEGFELIRSGQAHTVVVGGTESMSNIPLMYPREMSDFMGNVWRAKSRLKKAAALAKFRPRMLKPVVALAEGLKDPFSGLNMGETAEVLAKEFHITRREQDEFALQSHQRAVAATKSGRMADEIVPIYLPGEPEPLGNDIGPRENQTIEALERLTPYFDRRYGTVTAGNSSPITDGAAALLLMSEARVQVTGIQPLAWIRSYGFAGLDPRRMGLGPAVAAPIALRRAGLSMREIELVEMNEAFAAQVLANLRVFERPKLGEAVGADQPELAPIDVGRLNVNGGAIALGHPVGTSGTRITLTLAKEMKRRNLQLGLATLCVGGGQGAAMVLERR
ncbi:MAG TPA: thiolase family protein [Bdellovibrionota bacterium]|nr:thiolase family protein [Bdellovibrionota bacterium]